MSSATADAVKIGGGYLAGVFTTVAWLRVTLALLRRDMDDVKRDIRHIYRKVFGENYT